MKVISSEHTLGGSYLFKVNNASTKTIMHIASKLTMKTAKHRQRRRFGVINANFEHILHLFIVFLLSTLSM